MTDRRANKNNKIPEKGLPVAKKNQIKNVIKLSLSGLGGIFIGSRTTVCLRRFICGNASFFFLFERFSFLNVCVSFFFIEFAYSCECVHFYDWSKSRVRGTFYAFLRGASVEVKVMAFINAEIEKSRNKSYYLITLYE